MKNRDTLVKTHTMHFSNRGTDNKNTQAQTVKHTIFRGRGGAGPGKEGKDKQGKLSALNYASPL